MIDATTAAAAAAAANEIAKLIRAGIFLHSKRRLDAIHIRIILRAVSQSAESTF